VAALDAERFDVCAGGLGDSQPAQREQRDQRMLRRRSETGGHQQRAEFVTIQAHCMGLVVQPWPPYVRGGRMIKQLFLYRVPVEPSHRAQAAGDGSPGPATGL